MRVPVLGEIVTLMGTVQVLLLGFWMTMFLVPEALPSGFTPAQWFNKQHVQYPKTEVSNDDIYCNNEMRQINNYTHKCKPFNTFLNYMLENIIKICFTTSITCKNPAYNNCHKSTSTIPVTNCELTSGKYPNCRYHGTSKMAYFVIACDPPVPEDHSRNELLPVHLDNTVSNSGPILRPIFLISILPLFCPFASRCTMEICSLVFVGISGILSFSLTYKNFS